VKLSGQFRCGDSNELVERDLATAAFTVLGSSVGEYIIIDLGAIGDGSSYGHGLNSFGHVTGYATVDGNSHAFLWKCGTMIDLGTGGFDNSVGWGINDSEQIAGCLYDTAPEQDANGFVWEDGAFSDIGSGPNGVHPVEARGINVKGQVTGYYTLAEGNRRAFVCFGPTDGNSQWDDLIDSGISAIAGFAESNSVALAIDNDGNLAGYWDGGGGIGGFVRLTGVVEDAGRCDGNDMYLQAINSSGQAVGYSSDGGTDTAIFYQGGSWVALDPCSAESRANGINSAGEIVGKYYDGNDWQAFIWRGGFRHDLKQQLALTSSAQNWWKLTDANAINEQGQIVGYGTIDGEVHAYRMDPLPFAVNDPNLILWLRSDTGVEKDANNFVSQWVDQSFYGNDLEATESNRPVWISDTPCCDPVISFDGIDDALSTSLGTEYDGNSTIFLVVHTGADPNGALFASDDDTSDANAFEIRVTDGDSNLHLAASATYGISTKATESVILEVVIDDPNVSFYKNGRLIRTTTLSANEAKSYTHCVLGKSRDGIFLDYEVAEVLIFAGVLSDPNRQAVEDYLISKHELFGPSDIENPTLWLAADAGVIMDSNSRVSTWVDQSGNNDRDANQTDPCCQPTWEPSIIGCEPALLFTGGFLRSNPPDPNAAPLGAILALDNSGSMGEPSSSNPDADPNRFIEAKKAAIAFLEELRDQDPNGDYAGLVTFHADPDLVRDLTSDLDLVISDINSEELPTGNKNGTSFSNAIKMCNNTFEDSTVLPAGHNRQIVFVTDGLGRGKNVTPIRNQAKRSKELGIEIHTVFIRDPNDPNDPNNDSATAEMLREISEITDGTYHEVEDPCQLSGVFLQILDVILVRTYGTTLSVVFRTDANTADRQVLFAEGDPNIGLSLYIDANELYFCVWDLETELSTTKWGPSYVHTAIEPDSDYRANLVYHYNDKIEGFLNGTAFGTPNSPAGKLPLHAMNHQIGGNPEPTVFHDDTNDANNYYVGHIAELLYYECTLAPNGLEGIEVHLAEKYGFELQDDMPPTANAGTDVSVTDDKWQRRGLASLSAVIGGQDANDWRFEWYEDGVLIAAGANASVELDVGRHEVELVVTDDQGRTSVDTVVVTVKDIPSTLASKSLIGHWKLDGDANDCSGNGFDANVVNAAEPNCWGDGRVNGAIRLDADSNEYLDLSGDGNNLQYLPGGGSGRTIMGWFEAGDNGKPTFFDYGTDDPNSVGSRFAVCASSRRAAVTVGTHIIGVDDIYPALKGWHHLAVVFEGGAWRSDQVKIFLDGVRKYVYTLDGSAGPVAVNTNTWWDNAHGYIGRDCRGNYFDGKIDDVRVYGRALRSSELSVFAAKPMRYHVVDLGLLGPSEELQESRASAINNQGAVVGTNTTLLRPDTKYYWRIDERNECAETPGATWEFTTGSE
jgi:probable HAF family extracellular repeat protein